MKFSVVAALSFVAVATALPSREEKPRFRVPDTMTIQEGSAKCGDQAQLSCCNKAKYAGDSTQVAEGPAAALLSNLAGAGSAAEGLGIFDQCSKIDIPIVNIVNVQDILNKKCQQNIACCAKSGSEANGDLIGANLPCIALGAIA